MTIVPVLQCAVALIGLGVIAITTAVFWKNRI